VKILAVLPAYNEASCLPAVLEELASCGVDLEALVVDDASTDGTAEVATALGARTLRLPIQLGPGGAVRAALRYARQAGFERVVRLDADGQHLAASVGSLLEALEREGADAVVGSRYRGEGSYRAPWHRRALQLGWSALLSRMVGSVVTDPTSGLWAFGPRAIAVLADHHPTGFAEPQLWLVLHRRGLRVVETPARMRVRAAGKSRLTAGHAALALADALLTIAFSPAEGRARR
jgi:glycosyltransferase involved in cell wall biosynthesis